MRFDPQHTASYYDQYGTSEWDRWEKNSYMRMQWRIFLHHLDRKVRKGDQVLDAGCGAGRFTRELIARGAKVTALDLSPVQLDLCRKNAPGAQAYLLGSVTDLGMLPDQPFDVVLALGGPISYCFDQAPQALGELLRVLRPGGWLGLSVMGVFGAIHNFLPGVLSLDAEVNREIVATGDLGRDVNSGHECHMFRVAELRELLERAGVDDILITASGWLSALHEFDLPEEGTAEWHWLLQAELEASEESPGAGTHLMAWAKRPGLPPDSRSQS
ncbi:MAG: class I SAM-dependent methyltransferase [Actinomycetota bacterium]